MNKVENIKLLQDKVYVQNGEYVKIIAEITTPKGNVLRYNVGYKVGDFDSRQAYRGQLYVFEHADFDKLMFS